jgi:hypothetical protein
MPQYAAACPRASRTHRGSRRRSVMTVSLLEGWRDSSRVVGHSEKGSVLQTRTRAHGSDIGLYR